MKNKIAYLFVILFWLLITVVFGQVNNFPWKHNFDNNFPLQQDTNDFGDWLLKTGGTPSFNTGPQGDHTTGNGVYFYVESSGQNYGSKVFTTYTPTFDVSATYGKVLSFWYHMFGPAMGELEIAIIDTAGNYTFIDAYNGDQGMEWKLGYYPLDSFNIQHDFKIAFVATTGTSFTSDICIDDIMISDPYPIIYGCMDTVSSNYDSLATINTGCIYINGCTDPLAENYNPWANVDDGTCVMEVACNPGQALIEIAILLDNWPGETSWEITDTSGNILHSIPSGTYDYTQVGQTVFTEVCVPFGDSIIFTLNDTYGDGIGGGSVVGNCIVINLDCEDTIFALNPPNFGYSISSNVYASDSCSNDTIIYGCTDEDYIEYNELATIDDGSCSTLAIYGCTDPAAFNYDPTAHRMELTSPCDYNLILYDAGGDSWGNCWLGVRQGNSLWKFKIDSNNVYSDTFSLTLSAYDEVYVYYFEIPTPQQNPQQLDIQTIQNSFKLENAYGEILYEGNNPWPGPNENKLRNFKNPEDIYVALPYCDTECIDVVYGCLDSLAYNYNEIANTADTCYYAPGCMSPAYLEYHIDTSNAVYSDFNIQDSCKTLAVFGCTDSASFNYDPLANVDNGGCTPVILGCMNILAFNYDPLANTSDTCIPIIYGCIDPTMFNYDPNANTDDGNCIPYVYGCTDSTAFNYDPNATADNGSCIQVVYGCMDPNAWNYDVMANVNDTSSCLYSAGCITGAGIPYWLNDPCYAWVIEIDEYCCENEWDTICQATYDYCSGTWSGPLLQRTKVKKELITVTDLLGRPTNKNKNKLMFYIYDDGTVEKKLIKK